MVRHPPLALIGARLEELVDMPGEWHELFCRVAAFTARQGHPLHCGAAHGCDQWAAEAALAAGGSLRVVLPWAGFAGEWPQRLAARYPEKVEVIHYDPKVHLGWADWFEQFHPSPRSPGVYSRQCLIRVGGILEGTAGVVALPGDGCDLASRYALLLAEALGIPAWDLSNAEVRAEWRQRIESPEVSDQLSAISHQRGPARAVPEG